MGGCFPCFGSPKHEGNGNSCSNGVKQVEKKEFMKQVSGGQSNGQVNGLSSDISRSWSSSDSKKELRFPKEPTDHIAAQTFTFRELATATKNFRQECLLGEGGFGRVYKGGLESTGQVVAVKQLDRNGLQGNREFLVEVLMLSLLHHPNLVNLIGYCADGDQRLLVYEYMPLGSLEDHLHDLPPDKEPLDWSTRMKIAAGAAKGLEYLHDKANPPVIYRDLKSSNILLDEAYFSKLSDFGLAKLGPVGDKTHVSTRVMGTYGYCAPEYAMTGQLTLKSDVYSFGVVFLELIAGRKAIDITRGAGEHHLVAWARPLFRDRRKFPKMVDPLLQGQYPTRGLYQALAVAAMCLQENAAARPLIGDVVTALTYLVGQAYDPNAHSGQSISIGPSTLRHWDEPRNTSNSTNSLDNSWLVGHQQISPSTYWKRYSDSAQEFDTVAETVGGSEHKRDLDDLDSQRDSSASASAGSTMKETPTTRNIDRERAVAEAKVWGENWMKERKRMDGNATGSF